MNTPYSLESALLKFDTNLLSRHHCKSIKKYSCGIRRARARVWRQFGYRSWYNCMGKELRELSRMTPSPFAERSLARSRGLDVVQPDKKAMMVDGGWAAVGKGNSSGG